MGKKTIKLILKMGTNKSTTKILDFLEKQNKPVTITKIIQKLSLNDKTAKESLLLLKRLNVVEIITNGRTSLIFIKNEVKNEPD